jgi:hypothetical protein
VVWCQMLTPNLANWAADRKRPATEVNNLVDDLKDHSSEVGIFAEAGVEADAARRTATERERRAAWPRKAGRTLTAGM